MRRGVIWATKLAHQRIILGVLMILLAYPTYVTYTFPGAELMAVVVFAAGICGLLTGMMYPHADITDQRDTFLGAAIAVAFLVRFVVFIVDDYRSVEGGVLSLSAQLELYRGASAPIIHVLLVYLGAVIATRPARNRREGQ